MSSGPTRRNKGPRPGESAAESPTPADSTNRRSKRSTRQRAPNDRVGADGRVRAPESGPPAGRRVGGATGSAKRSSGAGRHTTARESQRTRKSGRPAPVGRRAYSRFQPRVVAAARTLAACLVRVRSNRTIRFAATSAHRAVPPSQNQNKTDRARFQNSQIPAAKSLSGTDVTDSSAGSRAVGRSTKPRSLSACCASIRGKSAIIRPRAFVNSGSWSGNQSTCMTGGATSLSRTSSQSTWATGGFLQNRVSPKTNSANKSATIVFCAAIAKRLFMTRLASFGVFVEQLANFCSLFPAQPLLINQLHDQGRDRIGPQTLDERFEFLPENVRLRGCRREYMHKRTAVAGDQSLAFQPLQERMDGGKLGFCAVGINDLGDGLGRQRSARPQHLQYGQFRINCQ